MGDSKKLPKKRPVDIDISGNGNVIKGNILLRYKEAIRTRGYKNIIEDNFGSNKISPKINKYVLYGLLLILLAITGIVFFGKEIDCEKIFQNACNKLGLFFKESDMQKPDTMTQQVMGVQSSAISVQGSQNTNINVNYSAEPTLAIDKIKFEIASPRSFGARNDAHSAHRKRGG